MREQFRVFDKISNNICQVAAIEYIDRLEGRPGYNVFVDSNKSKEQRWIEAKDGQLLQYTTINDKNGTKIFDQDLVKFYSKGNWITCMVVWNQTGMWSLKWPDGYINNWPIDGKKLEVVGSFLKNPELLK